MEMDWRGVFRFLAGDFRAGSIVFLYRPQSHMNPAGLHTLPEIHIFY
jgi:hypothetical protein